MLSPGSGGVARLFMAADLAAEHGEDVRQFVTAGWLVVILETLKRR